MYRSLARWRTRPLATPAGGVTPRQDEDGERRVYTGALVGMGGALGGRSATFTLTLTGSTPRPQVLRYAELLRTQGQDALLKQLEGREVGRFAIEGQTGRAINFAYVQNVPEGQRIIVLFERWIQPFELRHGRRSQEYPFSYLELSVDRNGRGSGTLIGAAKVYFEREDPDTLNVENFGTYPVRVVNVERKN
jgi:hypothetical protein